MTVTATDGDADPSNGLVRRAVSAVAGEGTDVSIAIASDIPIARGLGSSAACIASGLLIGAAISGRDLDRAELLRIGTEIEGHPDNLAASLYGGLTAALPNGDVLRFQPADTVRPLILVPGNELSTDEARRALPETVSHGDAVANLARASGLLALLSGAAFVTSERLLECTEDLIHQPYRAQLMPQTHEAVVRLRSEGIAAVVSGAGPSILCLVPRGDGDAAAKYVDGWDVLDVDWDLRGARLLEG